MSMSDLFEALDILKTLNEETLDDFIYDIREREVGEGTWEGNSWDGPRVTRWADTVDRAKTLLAKYEKLQDRNEE